jgi:hypothetical protein
MGISLQNKKADPAIQVALKGNMAHILGFCANNAA